MLPFGYYCVYCDILFLSHIYLTIIKRVRNTFPVSNQFLQLEIMIVKFGYLLFIAYCFLLNVSIVFRLTQNLFGYIWKFIFLSPYGIFWCLAPTFRSIELIKSFPTVINEISFTTQRLRSKKELKQCGRKS